MHGFGVAQEDGWVVVKSYQQVCTRADVHIDGVQSVRKVSPQRDLGHGAA